MSMSEKTAERKARIMELTDRGVTAMQIAQRLGVAPSTVYLILRQAGRPAPRNAWS